MKINFNANSAAKSIGHAAVILVILTFLSRLFGLYRDTLFAAVFAPGDVLDAYNVAFRLPDLFFNLLILGTLTVAFIPVYTEYFHKDARQANIIASTVINGAFLGMTALMVILWFFVPQITHLIAPGFSGAKFAMTVTLTRFFLLSPIIFTVSSVFTSVLNAHKRFVLPALAPIFYNVGIIVGIKFLYPIYGIYGLAYGVLAGAIAHLLVQLPGMTHSGFNYGAVLNLRHAGVKKIFKLFLPRIFGMDMSQVSLFIVSIVGSTLASGTISRFALASNIQAAPVGVFAISFAIASFPDLSEHFVKKENLEFSNIISRTAVQILFIILPLSILMILTRAQIIRFIYGHGRFSWTDTYLTANALGIFAASIFAQSLSPLFARAFYAMQNTWIPVLVGIASIIINALFSYWLRGDGVIGLAIGFSIATIFNMILLLLLLLPRLEEFDLHYVFREIVKILVGCIFLSIATYAALHALVKIFPLTTTLHVFLQGALSGLCGVIVFLVLGLLLKMENINVIKKFLKI